jgi:hypothetical protein
MIFLRFVLQQSCFSSDAEYSEDRVSVSHLISWSEFPSSEFLTHLDNKIKVLTVYEDISGVGDVRTSPFILNIEISWRRVVKFKSWLLYPQERTPVPIEQEAGWAPEHVWTSAEEQ